jgi:homoserine kinase
VTVEEGAGVEIEGEGRSELPRDASHLTLRAFAVFASPEHYRFRFVNRIPLERGLGSSAAAIAAGLVAGAAVAGRSADHGELLAGGRPIEGHADNLAASLYGGVCFAMKRNGTIHAARIASDMPAAAIVAMPEARTHTGKSRGALPATVTHADAAHNAASAALLGAAIAAGTRACCATRSTTACTSSTVRLTRRSSRSCARSAPDGTVGVTLSGSGPSVVVWAETARADDVALEVEARVPAARASSGCVSHTKGAHAEMSVYDRTDPSKRNSAALTDGVDRAPARAMLKASASRTRTSRGR